MKNLLTVLLFASLFSTAMFADVIMDDQAACSGKTADDECSIDGKAGFCVKSTCSRLDYSKGTPPSSVSYECLICKPAAKTGESGCSALPVDFGNLLPFLSLLLGLALISRIRRAKA